MVTFIAHCDTKLCSPTEHNSIKQLKISISTIGAF